MHPILFTIGSLNFYTHGVMAVLGIVVGISFAYFLSAKNELENSFLADNMIFTVLFGIIGARITYYFLYPEQFSNFREVIFLMDGGLVSYGGFILGGLALFTLLKIQKQPVLEWFDVLSIGFILGLFFGRLGDLFAGDYSGASKLTSFSSLAHTVITPAYEAVLCLVIFAVLALSFIKMKEKLETGQIFLEMILLYSGGRFIIDFWRDDKPVFSGLSISQLVSLVFFVSSAVLFCLTLVRKNKGVNYELT